MSRGTKAILAYAPQVTVGTIPAAADFKTLPRTSDSLNNSVEMTDSETINDSRIKTAGLVTSATAEGDVEVEFIKGTYDDLMAAAAGNEWVDGTPTTTSTLTFGGDVTKMFAIQKHNKDIGQFHLWQGMQVNTFNLTIPAEGFITMSFGFMGSSYDNAITAYAADPTSSATSPKATSLSVGDIKIDGSTLKNVACVTDFSFELTNNIENRKCLGSGLYGSKLMAMLADMTGSLTVAYSQHTQSLINKQLTGAPVKIEADIKLSDDTVYRLTIPKAQISGDIPSGGKDLLDATLNYSVYADTPADAPTLTRITA